MTTEDAPSTGTPAQDQPATVSVAEANATLTAPGQLFEMEDRDIRGISTRTWKNAPETLRTILDLSLGHGDKTFLVYEDERTSFAEHYRIACTLAHRLRDEFSIAPGDRVAIAMRNLPEWVMAFWAISLTGAIVVPLNAWWSGEELRYGLEDSGSKIAFVDMQRAEAIRPFLGGLSGFTSLIVADEHRTANSPTVNSGTAGSGSDPARRRVAAGWLGAGDRMALRPCARGGGCKRLAPRRRHRSRGRRHHLLHLGHDGSPQGRRRHAPQHLHQPDEPLLHQHAGTAAVRQVARRSLREGAERDPLVGAPLPCHRLSLRHGGEHRRRREDRHDAPLRSASVRSS